MNKIYIGTNLKMYKNIQQTKDFLRGLIDNTKDLHDEINLFVIPSFTSLPAAMETAANSHIMIGAQNMHYEECGQFTGEVSPLMLEELNINIVEIGHSDRRNIFRETDTELNKKVISAVKHGFTALLCVGELLADKECAAADDILNMQIRRGLYNITQEEANNIWIAYEPVWAIGVNGTPAKLDYVQERHRNIKQELRALFPHNEIPVLFGGSVNRENASELIAADCVDGLFVGRAAWDAEGFNILIRNALHGWKNDFLIKDIIK